MDGTRPNDTSRSDRFHLLVAGLILLVTILGAGVALLGTHASVLESQATRGSVVMAVELMGALQSGSLRAAYDTDIVVDMAAKMMETAALWQAALDLELEGRSDEAALYATRAEELEAEILAMSGLSVLYTDERYAPQGENDLLPDLDAYSADWREPIDQLLEEQQEQAEAADRWGDKADAHTSVGTVLALSLFLYGLSLAIRGRVRLIFTGVGTLLVLLALLWTAWTIVVA
ncbi:MAG: hypothetical protein E3J64_01595 [Anaerolineales bacterium]|nr:MAG: hypothetical protein E3J64_01595 [Anaerolineales bacterium]